MRKLLAWFHSHRSQVATITMLRKALVEAIALADEKHGVIRQMANDVERAERLTQRWAEQAEANAIDAGRWRAVASNLAMCSDENAAIYRRQVRVTFNASKEIS